MNTQTSKYLTALTIALQADTENNKNITSDISFTKALGTTLAMLQMNGGENTTSEEEFEQRINQQENYWTNYLEETKKQLNEAIKTFEAYDQKGLLTKFFQKIKTRKNISPQRLHEAFDTLNQYAFEAFENKTWNDVYLMFLFITVYIPTEAKPYLFLAKATEETQGLDQASAFYQMTCDVLKDPDLYFFAAECELKRDNKDKSKEYLLKIKEMLDNGLIKLA